MPTNEKKGITVKIDAELHAEVRQYLDQHSMTMADFVTMALQDELHPKFEQKEEKSMEKMRTLAFQVPEDLFQRIKDYLHRNNMTQRQFVIGLIENDIERDLLNYCNGELTACQRCYINFFDAEDNYLESYQLRPSMQDLMQLEIDSWSMTFD